MLLKTITSAGGEYANTTKWPDVPATCPIGGATAASHGHSRVDHPGPRRSQYQQMAGRQRHRVPKLMATEQQRRHMAPDSQQTDPGAAA